MTTPDAENVQVAVRVRPMNEAELTKRCRPVVHKSPTDPIIFLGDHHQFTFDQVFPPETQQDAVFTQSIEPLVEGALQGRNATVLAYGQTGSGKTYTMGTGCEIDLTAVQEGVLPRSATYMYRRMDMLRAMAKEHKLPEPEFSVEITFVELYQNKFYDLFDSTPGLKKESNVRVRDEKTPEGVTTISVTGLTAHTANSVDDVMSLLRRGSLDRVTASTDMNARSSRSHAIFTVFVSHRRCRQLDKLFKQEEQSETSDDVPGITDGDAMEFVVTTAKFNFVDLAGSERLKRTHATGERAKEGIDINSGLLALGNVISALGDPSRRGGHVPYRSNKLTRILQDSLGGNSKTVMLACVSPADDDLVETLNTLKYANRARNIQNKVVVNQDSASREIQFLRETIHKLQLELAEFRAGGVPLNPDSEEANDAYREIQHLRQRNASLLSDVNRLTAENAIVKAEAVKIKVATLRASAEPLEGESSAGDDSTADAENVMPSATSIASVAEENIDLKARIAQLEADLNAATIAAGAAASGSGPSSPLRGGGSLGNSSFSLTTPVRPRSAWAADVTDIQKVVMDGAKLLEEAQRMDMLEDSSAEAMVDHQALEASFDSAGDPLADSDINGLDSESDSDQDEEDPDDEEGDDGDDLIADDGEPVEAGEAPASSSVSRTQSAPAAESSSGTKPSKQRTRTTSASQAEEDGNTDGDVKQPKKRRGRGRRKDEENTTGGATTAAASAIAMNKQLVSQLGQQIAVQEDLLHKLSLTNNELEKQKLLYEKRLSQADQERRKIEAERDKLRTALGELSGEKSSTADKLRRAYEQQIKELSQRAHRIEKDRQEQARLEEDRLRRAAQIETLRRSIQQAKQQRRQLMEQAQQDMKRHRQQKLQQDREIHRLRKENAKSKSDATKWERLAKNKDTTRQRALEENKRLKERLEETRKELRVVGGHSNGKGGDGGSGSTGNANKGGGSGTPWRRARRRTDKAPFNETAARRKQTKLLQESRHAVQYQMTRNRLAELIAKRDRLLREEHRRYTAQLKELGEEEDNAAAVQEVREELERIETESDYIAEAIKEEETELLAKEAAGIRSSIHVDEISERGERLIANSSAQEARYLLKALFSIVVQNNMAAERTKVRVKELEMESEHKDAILKSLAFGAMGSEEGSSGTTLEEGASGDVETIASNNTSTSVAATTVEVPSKTSRKSGGKKRKQKQLAVSNDTALANENADKGAERPSTPTRSPDGDGNAAAPPTLTDERARPASSSDTTAAPDGVQLREKTANASVRRRIVSAIPSRLGRLRRGTANTAAAAAQDASPAPFTATLRGASSNATGRRGRNKDVDAVPEVIVPEAKRGAGRHRSHGSGSGSPLLQLTHTAQGHRDEVLCVAALDNRLVTGSKDRAMRVFDLETGQMTASLTEHESHVRAVAHVPLQLFSVTRNLVRVWDARTCTEVSKFSFRKKDPIATIQVARDGSVLYAAAGKYLRLWDLRMNAEIEAVAFKGKVETLALNEADATLALSAIDHKLRIFDVKDPFKGDLDYQLLEPPHYSRVQALTFCGDVLFSGSHDCSIKKWCCRHGQWYNHYTTTGAFVGKAAESIPVSALTTLPGNKHYVSGSSKGGLRVWSCDARPMLEEHALAHSDAINALCATSTHLFSASADKTVKIWSLHHQSNSTATDKQPTATKATIVTELPNSPLLARRSTVTLTDDASLDELSPFVTQHRGERRDSDAGSDTSNKTFVLDEGDAAVLRSSNAADAPPVINTPSRPSRSYEQEL